MNKPAEATGLAVVIEVSHAQGSVPRDNGTWMIVFESESNNPVANLEGTIGGGHLEHVAIAKAHELIQQVRRNFEAKSHNAIASLPSVSERYALGPSLGQCCGGVLHLQYQVVSTDALASIRKKLSRASARFHLQLYGAGHVGQAIVRALMPITCTVDWIDEREAFFQSPSSDNQIINFHQQARINKLWVDSPAAEVKRAPANSAFLD